MQRDLLAVVRRYVEIKEELIRIKIGRQGDASVLEINVEFDAKKVGATGTKGVNGTPPVHNHAAGQARGKSAGKRRQSW